MEWRLLEAVPHEAARQLLQVARRRTFSRNEVVFHQDDPADSLHLISKGKFSVRVMTPLGDVATIAVRASGESFGEMALVGMEPRRSATVVALEDAETFAVYRDDFESLRRRYPAVDDALLRFLANEVRVLNERLLESLYVPVEKRVLRRLVELAPLYRTATTTSEIPWTQEALAELAGASRPTVNQVLREEEKHGRLELLRGKIRIVDLKTLERHAR